MGKRRHTNIYFIFITQSGHNLHPLFSIAENYTHQHVVLWTIHLYLLTKSPNILPHTWAPSLREPIYPMLPYARRSILWIWSYSMTSTREMLGEAATLAFSLEEMFLLLSLLLPTAEAVLFWPCHDINIPKYICWILHSLNFIQLRPNIQRSIEKTRLFCFRIWNSDFFFNPKKLTLPAHAHPHRHSIF